MRSDFERAWRAFRRQRWWVQSIAWLFLWGPLAALWLARRPGVVRLVAAGVLLLIWLGSALSTAAGSGTSRPRATATAAQQAAFRPSPTPPAQPSSRPTATPIPTPTNRYADELAYLSTFVRQNEDLAASLEQVASLLSEAQDDPMMLRNPSWKRKLTSELAKFKEAYREAKAMKPPPRFAAMHVTYALALGQLSLAADDFAAGIEGDVRKLEKAADEMTEAKRLLQEARRQLDEEVEKMTAP